MRICLNKNKRHLMRISCKNRHSCCLIGCLWKKKKKKLQTELKKTTTAVQPNKKLAQMVQMPDLQLVAVIIVVVIVLGCHRLLPDEGEGLLVTAHTQRRLCTAAVPETS